MIKRTVVLDGILLIASLLDFKSGVAGASEIIGMRMNSSMDNNEYDDRTLLDTFGEAAKQYLTQNVVPMTDPECKWDWRFVRCEPFCICNFAPMWGDYHVGRACRLAEKQDCDPLTSVPDANPLQMIIQRTVRGSQLALQMSSNSFNKGFQKLQTKVCENTKVIQCSGSGELPLIAWQERLFCSHKIPQCDEALNEM